MHNTLVSRACGVTWGARGSGGAVQRRRLTTRSTRRAVEGTLREARVDARVRSGARDTSRESTSGTAVAVARIEVRTRGFVRPRRLAAPTESLLGIGSSKASALLSDYFLALVVAKVFFPQRKSSVVMGHSVVLQREKFTDGPSVVLQRERFTDGCRSGSYRITHATLQGVNTENRTIGCYIYIYT